MIWHVVLESLLRWPRWAFTQVPCCTRLGASRTRPNRQVRGENSDRPHHSTCEPTYRIGREIQQQSCRYPTVLRHYQKKAAADRAAFATYVNTVVTALRRTPLPMIQADTITPQWLKLVKSWNNGSRT